VVAVVVEDSREVVAVVVEAITEVDIGGDGGSYRGRGGGGR
jgi:hypothetical protein